MINPKTITIVISLFAIGAGVWYFSGSDKPLLQNSAEQSDQQVQTDNSQNSNAALPIPERLEPAKTSTPPPSSVIAVADLLANPEKYLNQTIQVKGKIIFEYSGTTEAGNSSVSAAVAIGIRASDALHIYRNGKTVYCYGTVDICDGFKKDSEVVLTGIVKKTAYTYYFDIGATQAP